MKFHIHLVIQIILFLVLTYFLGVNLSLAIVIAHFVPSLDYAMKRTGFHPKLHRKLFHNLFVGILVLLVLWNIVNFKIGALGFTNFLLHVIMDARGKGVAIFFPLSEFRLNQNH